MYIPRHFEQQHKATLHDLIRDFPLATVVVNTNDRLSANHIPMIISQDESNGLRLQGHVARANPLCQAELLGEALAVFQGPNAYISPNWYATKKLHGKVVPTWNYTTVHATGQLNIIDDRDWTLAMISNLTDKGEASQTVPWAVTDAPADFTEALLSAIIGIELTVTNVSGKWKVSQNQPVENRDGVRAGLKTQSGSIQIDSSSKTARQHAQRR
jgi:transcriptional regulator